MHVKKRVPIQLNQQESYQIYKYPSKHVPRFSYGQITQPNCVHQCDILFLTHDHYRGKTYKAVLNVVDCASRFKASVPLRSKSACEVAKGFRRIYKGQSMLCGHLILPKLCRSLRVNVI